MKWAINYLCMVYTTSSAVEEEIDGGYKKGNTMCSLQ
jgi:hypothetical protein